MSADKKASTRGKKSTPSRNNHNNNGKCLESVLVQRLEAPRQVGEYGRFEELSKLYAIERPYVARTQIELLFDVYDGRKLRSSGSLELDSPGNQRASSSGPGDEEPAAGLEGKRRQISRKRGGANSTITTTTGNKRSQLMTWCRLLFANRRSRTAATSALMSAACCLAPSDTHQELGLVSASSSLDGSLFASCDTAQDNNKNNAHHLHHHQHASTMLTHQQDSHQVPQVLEAKEEDDEEQLELKHEALRLVSSALLSVESNCFQHHHQNQLHLFTSGGGAGGQLALDSGLGSFDGPSRLISVCLLDRRHLASSRKASQLGGISWRRLIGSRAAQEKRATSSEQQIGKTTTPPRPPTWRGVNLEDSVARNGRQWARASARFMRLRRRLRQSRTPGGPQANRPPPSRGGAKKPPRRGSRSNLLAYQLEWVAIRGSRKYWRELRADWQFNVLSRLNNNQQQQPPSAISGGLTKKDSEQLIELVKTSLNQLIDAQLLLRNKLTGTSEQPSSLLGHQNSNSSSNSNSNKSDYETLLRNNFNLLKIWQNLEETKRLACFVCEPIKATLADLFYFNARRQDWPASELSALSEAGQQQLNLANSPQLASNSKCLLLVSPLVCLDAIQVKRGLLQILEALNFLHGICKLIHRNLTPKNVLVAQQDNWKLSGLEFALRFESTTISESNSMMAHEFSINSFPTPFRFRASSALNSGATSVQQLRRQKTLHQTKCQEFVRQPKCALLQPDLNYLAPEIWKNSKCSHKSDLFSFGLILGQVYDLCQHRAPIDCRQRPEAYESELKKLSERRRGRLAQLVPFEMRQALVEMLEIEPNLRPSANYLLQLFRRPIELCKTNEDSLRHLKASLNYLEARMSSAAAAATALAGNALHPSHHQQAMVAYHGSQQNISANGHQINRHQQQQQQSRQISTTSYFRRVTSSGAQRDAQRRQTKSLQLLNLLVRSVDSLGQQAGQQRQEMLVELSQQQQQQQEQNNFGQTQVMLGSHRSASFGTLWLQFEQTLETLRQVYKTNLLLGGSIQAAQRLDPSASAAEATTTKLLASAASASVSMDTRSMLFIVVLHRRLLEQVALMRAQLPPLSRLMASPSPATLGNSHSHHHHHNDHLLLLLQDVGVKATTTPVTATSTSANTQTPGQSANHRALAQAEEKLLWLVSKHSLARLAESLSDPLLKLDEFLLVFELLNDLVIFVGQKCKQSFAQRGKQLLNELTPVTGCPSLSSSEEEDEEELQRHHLVGELLNGSEVGGAEHEASRAARGANSRSQLNLSTGGGGFLTRMNQPQHNQQHRFSDHEAYLQDLQTPTSGRSSALSRPPSRQRQQQQPNYFQLPTSINITAPSPMGSVRDMSGSARLSADSTAMMLDFSSSSSPAKSHQQQQHQDDASLAQLTGSQLNLGGRGAASSSKLSINDQSASTADPSKQPDRTEGHEEEEEEEEEHKEDEIGQQKQEAGSAGKKPSVDDKSRSQLIDELLRSINDDSFNEYIDFNNKLTAATRTQSSQQCGPNQDGQLEQRQQQHTHNHPQQQQRPRSAMEGSQQLLNKQQISGVVATGQATSGLSPGGRPRTLNLSSNQTAAGLRSAAGRSSICITGSATNNSLHQHQQPSSTFDNVLRRMSTNLVQGFTQKMSTASQQMTGSTNLICDQTTTTTAAATQINFHDASGSSVSPSSGGAGLASHSAAGLNLRREKSSTSTNANSLYVDNQVPVRRHSDNTINVPRIQVALSSPQASGSRTNLNQRASVSASKLANKWKTSAKTNQREASDKLSPNLGGALSYMRRHSSGNTTDKNSGHQSDQNQSNGLGAQLLNASPFKKKPEAKSSSNLGLDFLISNRSMKRRCSAASMLGHQTQKKAEDLIDAGMKSVQNMFS